MERDLFDLKPSTSWVAKRLDVYEVLDSTNLRAEQLAKAGAPEGTLVVADRQTAGRGRLGRSFFSPGGRSLYLSLLLRPSMPPDQVHQHVFAAAVAVAETARQHLPDAVQVEIKWPNDVLLDGRKTSGINLPAHIESDSITWAVLGIGVNVNTPADEFPPELESIATSLRMAGGAELDRIAFAERLLLRLEREIDRLRAEGFGPVLDCWNGYFRMRGTRAEVGGSGLEGTIDGVDPDGALRLLVSDPTARDGVVVERVLAGDLNPRP